MTFLKNPQWANRNQCRTFQPPWGFLADSPVILIIFGDFPWFSFDSPWFSNDSHCFSLNLLVFIGLYWVSWFFSDSRRLAASPRFFRIFLIFFRSRVGNRNFLLFRRARVVFCGNSCVFGKREVSRGKLCSCFGAAGSARERNAESVGGRRGVDEP